MSDPRVTVVIPAYRSEAWIAHCLESLVGQTYDDIEVVVVNSSSYEPTRSIVAEAMPDASFVQSEKRLLPHDARVVGIRIARGALVAFIDPDCRAYPDWLELLVGHIDRGEQAVAGAVVPVPGAPSFEVAAFACKQRFLLPGPAGRLRWAPTANLLVRRETYEKVGGFPPCLFSGDVVLGERMANAGILTRFEPEARVEHRYDATWAGFIRERLVRGSDYGRVRPALADWSGIRRLVHVVGTPLAVLRLVRRTTRAARRAGLPLGGRGRLWVVAGQTCWALGEAFGYLRPLELERPGSRRGER